jgi:hypothetical protein
MKTSLASQKKGVARPEVRRGESGQVLVLVALLLIGLLAVAGLVLDGGNLYLQRRSMQNAADAGALAGMRVLALDGSPDQARAAAQEYAIQRNLADTCVVTVTSSTVTVTALRTVHTAFARVVGVGDVTIAAQATAGLMPLGAVAGLAPIAVRDFDYEYGKSYTIWDDTKDADPTTGNISGGYRGWLNLDCVYPASCGDAGASNLKEWMRDGYPEVRSVNTWIRGSSGTKASVIAEAQVGQILKIVIYDQISDLYQNKSYYHVYKLAAFEVTAVKATGNPKGIQGKFCTYVMAGPPTGVADGGLRTINLVH